MDILLSFFFLIIASIIGILIGLFLDMKSYIKIAIIVICIFIPMELYNDYFSKINNKKYGFLLTPAGENIKTKALATKAVTLQSTVKGHPMNYQISAYELNPTTSLSYETYTIIDRNAPARDINGLLQHYAQKKGLLGASRRRTRRRTLLKSR